MPIYSYTGRARGGELSSGLMEGDTPDGVAARLLGTGITPIEVVPAKVEGSGDVGQALRKLGFGKPRTADLVMFSRQMYTITKSGIPLLRGIKGLAASTHNAVLRETLEEILRDLEGGRDLAGSLGAPSEDLSAAVRQHHPRRRRDRHAGGVVPPPRRVHAAGPGHAGPHQGGAALSRHRHVRDRRRDRRC